MNVFIGIWSMIRVGGEVKNHQNLQNYFRWRLYTQEEIRGIVKYADEEVLWLSQRLMFLDTPLLY
jgi:hypothetical protein